MTSINPNSDRNAKKMLEIKPNDDLKSLVVQAIDQLESQAGWCDELRGLAARQADVIDSGDVNELLDLLQRRQTLIDGLIQSQEQLAPVTSRLVAEEDNIDQALHGRLRRLIDRVRESLAHVMEADERDQHALQERLQTVGAELKSATAAKSAHRAYVRPNSSPSPRFTDRKG